ncbi:Xaa-Pro peptidase family protein [uncultured Clostridium sp.]|uniref:M24 family metallopeptidase n=1 Tax=uncultured Clostridium sp. TaxID=59620 RepID=UPI00258FD6A8|nr:Xaa-Pro peptidase family protein [uncultured Clostridium sp.]
MKENRVKKVIDKMKEENLDQILVSAPSSLFYLTGKWFHPGNRMIVLLIKSNGDHKLINNKLFPVNEDLGVDIVWYEDTDNPTEVLSKYIDNTSNLGIDKTWPSHYLIELMELNAAKEYKNSSVIIDELRMIKDAEEIEFMKEASKINDKTMKELWGHLKEGMTELECVDLLKELYEKNASNKFSFSPIIAFCPNGADPHHETDDTRLKIGDSIVIDIGCVYNDYCSDMTRTVFFGKVPSNKHESIYSIVKEANERAIEAVKPGVKFSDIDKAAREYITENGYGEYFTHRTGHCIGIDCHDFGDVSGVNDKVLEPGMIFSVEPGVYLKDDFGVRIEDLVLVTKDGHEVLNCVSKEVTVIK